METGPSSDAHSDHVRHNRDWWDGFSDEYEAIHHGAHVTDEFTWGVWAIPDRDLRILPHVAGMAVLELGCGAAQCSIRLARRGAHPVGLDASASRLAQGHRLMGEVGVSLPLVQANAEHLPFHDERFDLVFCDWGAMTFADPYLTVPEAARVLRPGGLLAFSTHSPLMVVAFDTQSNLLRPGLARDYFGMHRFVTPDDSVEFQLPYGEWIRLFRRSGLDVEDLVETRPEEEAESEFWSEEDRAWSRRWPGEAIWKVRKRPEGSLSSPSGGATPDGSRRASA
jgi:ubiquinone/menaquinone biosynthesis C-methylase UbiE